MALINSPKNLKGELLATQQYVNDRIAEATTGVSSFGGQTGDITVGSNLEMNAKEIKLKDSISLTSLSFSGNISVGNSGNIVFDSKNLFAEDKKINKELLPELGKTYTAGKFINISQDNQISVAGNVSEGTETFDFSANNVNIKSSGSAAITGGANSLSVSDSGISYNGNAQNTPNGVLVLNESGEVPSTSSVVSIGGKKGAITLSNDLTISEANQIGIASGTFLRLSNTNETIVNGPGKVTFNAEVALANASINSASAETLNVKNLVYNGNGVNTAGGIPVISSNGYIEESIIPPLAITRVLTVEANGQELLDLLKKAVTDGGLSKVENSELIMVYRPEQTGSNSSSDDEYYDKVCGEYFVISNEVEVANLQLTDVKKTYTPSKTIITVNGKTPVDNNITINLSDISDVTDEQARVLKTIETDKSAGEKVTIDSIELATKNNLSDSVVDVPKMYNLNIKLGFGVVAGDYPFDTVEKTQEGSVVKISISKTMDAKSGYLPTIEFIRATRKNSSSNIYNIIPDVKNSYSGNTATIEIEFDEGQTGYGMTEYLDICLLTGYANNVVIKDDDPNGGSGGASSN